MYLTMIKGIFWGGYSSFFPPTQTITDFFLCHLDVQCEGMLIQLMEVYKIKYQLLSKAKK